MEQSETAAERRLVIAKDIVCEPNPWIDVPHGGVRLESMGDVGVARISQRVHNVVKISVPLDRVGLKIVSNTHVECEFPG